MRRAEEHPPAAGVKKCAGGLAVSRRDTRRVAGFEIERVNLVERIASLPFALKDQLGAVGAEVAFAAAPALEGELPDTREKRALPLGGMRAWPGGGEQCGDKQRAWLAERMTFHFAAGFSFNRPNFQLRDWP
tara:strand:+ start:1332 stop:1727 length:396 start_codon:yes stop_codon:yes gene_type:complete